MDGAPSNSSRISSSVQAEGLEQHGDVLAPLAVDPHPDRVALVDLELQPGPPRRDDLGDVDVLVGGLVQLLAEVDARAPDQLETRPRARSR